MLRTIGITLLVAFAGLACHPPTAPERGPLAHPTMTVQPIDFGLDAHIHAVSEGAAGGINGGGGGCGCN